MFAGRVIGHQWVTKKEYMEQGAGVIHRCFEVAEFWEACPPLSLFFCACFFGVRCWWVGIGGDF